MREGATTWTTRDGTPPNAMTMASQGAPVILAAAIALVAILPGCDTLVGAQAAHFALPSLDACAKVSYTREGKVAQITATCQLP